MNIIFTADILLVTTALIWVAFASISDIKKREVPNWLSFSLIAIAFSIRGIAALLAQQVFYFLYAVIAFVIFIGIANLFYYSKLFGGGDAKLLIALAPVFATAPFFSKISQNLIPISGLFLFSFVGNFLIIGAVYGILFSIFYAVKNKKRFSPEFKKIVKKNKKLFLSCLMGVLIFIILSFFSILFLILSGIFLIMPLFYSFIKAVENSSMIKKIKTSELVEGDWLIHAVKAKNKTIMPCVHGLNEKDIILLKKSREFVMIKTGLPFVPVFFLAILCSLFTGNLLLMMILKFL